MFKLFWELKDKTKKAEYLEALLRYLAGSARSITQEEIKEAVTKIFIEGGNVMETIAEKLMKEGMKKGIVKGKIDIVKVMKNKGLPLDKIAEYTGLSRKEIERLAL